MKGNLQRFVIDECHCISLWGREFRPCYLKLDFLCKLFPTVQVVMLTATATPIVQQDVCSVLSVVEPIVLRDNYNKLNLQYVIASKDGELDENIANEIKDCSCSLVYGAQRGWNVKSCVLNLCQKELMQERTMVICQSF